MCPGSIHPILVEIVSAMAGDDPPEAVSVLVDITERALKWCCVS
jgi:hypothetical protein